MNKAGNSSFSNRNSVSFKRESLLWTEFSVKIKGVSLGYNIRFLVSDLSSNSSSTSKFTKSRLGWDAIKTYLFHLLSREVRSSCGRVWIQVHYSHLSISFLRHRPFRHHSLHFVGYLKIQCMRERRFEACLLHYSLKMHKWKFLLTSPWLVSTQVDNSCWNII